MYIGGMQLRDAPQLPSLIAHVGQGTPHASSSPKPLLPQALRADAGSTVTPWPQPPTLQTHPIAGMPGGADHCGGDLLFPLLTLVHGAFRSLMPVFVMKSGAVALFSGSELVHGTLEHHPREERCLLGLAHISFAVQTPAPLLGASRCSEHVRRLHKELVGLGHIDARAANGVWHDATWLAVQHTPNGPIPKGKLRHDATTMAALPYTKVILYDVETSEPLVLYDASGGLGEEARTRARACFGFLDEYKFTLNREAGALGMDAAGQQRMLMLGIRNQGYNVKARPDTSRADLTVANPSGDLDGYVAHWDEPQLGLAAGREVVQDTFEAIAARLKSLLPCASCRLSEELCVARVRERLYCAQAAVLMSEDGLVNNVGVSAAYQSPAHVDRNDVAWTAAFAVKCC